MKKITPAEKRAITKEWAAEFPELTIYKNMWLIRVLGPFVQGICLDRDSSNSNYLPTFHLHNLARTNFDSISLTFDTTFRSPKGGAFHITKRSHDSSYLEYITTFKKQIPFLCSGDIDHKEVINAIECRVDEGLGDAKYPIFYWFNIITLYIWCNKLESASLLFDKAKKNFTQWPEEITKYMDTDFERFMRLQDYINTPATLREDVQKSITNLKLEKIKVAQII